MDAVDPRHTPEGKMPGISVFYTALHGAAHKQVTYCCHGKRMMESVCLEICYVAAHTIMKVSDDPRN